MQQTINRVNPEQHLIGPEGYFPNNAEFPALHGVTEFMIIIIIIVPRMKY